MDSVGEMFFMQNWKMDLFLSATSQQVAPSSAAPSRLQVAAGFSWDVGLSSLKPALAAQDGDSSDGEDEDIGSKVARKHISVFYLTCRLEAIERELNRIE